MQKVNQQPRRERRGCCSHKVVAVGFNTLHYDASVGVLNPPHESMRGVRNSRSPQRTRMVVSEQILSFGIHHRLLFREQGLRTMRFPPEASE